MSTLQLENLPKELIAHIATFGEALSVINLSLTSKTIRAATWDSLLFKQLLEKSQRLNWRHDSVDLEAIAKRAGNDTSVWARYAVADDQAWVLARAKEPLKSRKSSINFMPELSVVKHPFLKQRCWSTATHGPFDHLTSHVFCLTMALLSADEASLSGFHDPGQCEYCFSSPRENDPAFLNGGGALWTICSIATILRDALKIRRSVWPYQDAANVPYIDFPRADKIPLRPLGEGYSLPVPYSKLPKELLNTFMPCSGGWNDWYRQHNQALFNSAEFLTSGAWCGYYTQGVAHHQLDPPMGKIRFQRSISETKADCEKVSISAAKCIDGVGGFSLRGSMRWDGKVVKVTAVKTYDDGLSWEWDCRLTPFGIVGHWGEVEEGQLSTYGYVWLWKEGWTGQTNAAKSG